MQEPNTIKISDNFLKLDTFDTKAIRDAGFDLITISIDSEMSNAIKTKRKLNIMRPNTSKIIAERTTTIVETVKYSRMHYHLENGSFHELKRALNKQMPSARHYIRTIKVRCLDTNRFLVFSSKTIRKVTRMILTKCGKASFKQLDVDYMYQAVGDLAEQSCRWVPSVRREGSHCGLNQGD